MPSGRYRITVNGFRCVAETWDDALNWDGKHDEVFIATSVKHIDKDGNNLAAMEESYSISEVMGDTWRINGRVQAGSASDRGGIVSGDAFPSPTPWLQAVAPSPERNYPPFSIWEGELTRGEDAIFVTPTIWEWDPGQNAIEGWVKWIAEVDSQFGEQAKAIISGKAPQFGWIVDATSLGIKAVSTLFNVGGPLGSSGNRPIGYQKDLVKDPSGRAFSFSPKTIILDFDKAERLLKESPSGYGNGILAVPYMEDPYFRGYYVLFIQIERLGAVTTDTVPRNDGALVRELSDVDVYVMFGGAKFKIPDAATLGRLYGGWGNVTVVRNGSLAQITSAPKDGTLLKEEDSQDIWLIRQGIRHSVTSLSALSQLGGTRMVRTVPNGSLDALPLGEPLRTQTWDGTVATGLVHSPRPLLSRARHSL